MFLSDRDLIYAIESGKLIVDPETKVGPTSIDLHLDSVAEAKIWNLSKFRNDTEKLGIARPELRVGSFNYQQLAPDYLIAPPENEDNALVSRRGQEILIRPLGFLLWQTKERVGTPEENPDHILFINGKSTRTARTGLAVHITAPTIHGGWSGKITLELINLGPFDVVLKENDSIAQITVARLTSSPQESMRTFGSKTHEQGHVDSTHS